MHNGTFYLNLSARINVTEAFVESFFVGDESVFLSFQFTILC